MTGTPDDQLQRARQRLEEQRLIEAAARGSTAAFEVLYRLHVDRVHGLCRRMTQHRETAEDCAQETFLQAWRALPGFQNRSAFGTWLHTIAVNTVLARRRRLSPHETHAQSLDDAASAIADSAAHDPAVARDLESAIAALPPGARDVLVLVAIYGYAHEEAAAMLGIAAGTSKAQLHRARQLLATRLAYEGVPA